MIAPRCGAMCMLSLSLLASPMPPKVPSERRMDGHFSFEAYLELRSTYFTVKIKLVLLDIAFSLVWGWSLIPAEKRMVLTLSPYGSYVSDLEST